MVCFCWHFSAMQEGNTNGHVPRTVQDEKEWNRNPYSGYVCVCVCTLGRNIGKQLLSNVRPIVFERKSGLLILIWQRQRTDICTLLSGDPMVYNEMKILSASFGKMCKK